MAIKSYYYRFANFLPRYLLLSSFHSRKKKKGKKKSSLIVNSSSLENAGTLFSCHLFFLLFSNRIKRSRKRIRSRPIVGERRGEKGWQRQRGYRGRIADNEMEIGFVLKRENELGLFFPPHREFFLFLYPPVHSLSRASFKTFMRALFTIFSENPGNEREIFTRSCTFSFDFFLEQSRNILLEIFFQKEIFNEGQIRTIRTHTLTEETTRRNNGGDDISPEERAGQVCYRSSENFARPTLLRFQSCRLLSYYRPHCSTRERVVSESTFLAPFWWTR